MTPKLRYFECRGFNFPRLTTRQGGLPVLDTLVVDYTGYCSQKKDKKTVDDLLMLFSSFYNAKSLTVFSSVFHLLSFFPDELVNRGSPFGDLKCLKMDFSLFLTQSPLSDEFWKFLPVVKAYLLQKSPDAKCIMIYHNGSISRRIE
ncbi:hypothetical protein L1987_36549 [Smallanthus sonchifolius]|uniref:Uncharacterized protein n=1 Tax=Smallanthus sonchifolius TaxID=185202 RepID=A0ACB9HEK0_9ASTR|nr:hypothetical protein L1987_36549 [Smallanthus sonchifolius]